MKISFSNIPKLFGTKKDHLENVIVATVMLMITTGYQYISFILVPEFSFNWFEFIGTWSGLTTVWLSRTQNILCWPWGIISAASLGYFFSQIGLVGQQWLNLGYFLIVQIWAWPYWTFGGINATELPVTRLTKSEIIFTICTLAIGFYLTYTLINYIAPTSQHPILDAVVVSSSIVAQWLLGRKKLESWYLWLGPVNVLSILLFLLSGAYIVTALYVAFLIHAIFAIKSWRKDVAIIS